VRTRPNAPEILLKAFGAEVGDRTLHVGFCLGNETGFSAIGIAVIERLMMETSGGALHVVLVAHQDIAWDIVLRYLRSFTGKVLLFAFPDSDVYDAGTAEKYYSEAVPVFDDTGHHSAKLTASQRQRIREQKAAILRHPPSPPFFPIRRYTGRFPLDLSPRQHLQEKQSVQLYGTVGATMLTNSLKTSGNHSLSSQW
jgi:hypothetical protein